MNGPQHYTEAERLVKHSETAPGADVAALYLGQAQVHATLAHVAAQVDATASRGPGDVDPGWQKVVR